MVSGQPASQAVAVIQGFESRAGLTAHYAWRWSAVRRQRWISASGEYVQETSEAAVGLHGRLMTTAAMPKKSRLIGIQNNNGAQCGDCRWQRVASGSKLGMKMRNRAATPATRPTTRFFVMSMSLTLMG